MIYLAAAAAASFNLVCSGTLTSDSFYSGKQSEPYRYEYRMDLDQGKWCDGECRALHDFVNIGPTQLTLSSRDVDTPRQREFLSSTIDRETGEHRALSTSGTGRSILIIKWEGSCERGEFTGFPEFETKF